MIVSFDIFDMSSVDVNVRAVIEFIAINFINCNMIINSPINYVRMDVGVGVVYVEFNPMVCDSFSIISFIRGYKRCELFYADGDLFEVLLEVLRSYL